MTFKSQHCKSICVRERMNTAGMGSYRRPAPHPTYTVHPPSVNTNNKLTENTEGEREREKEKDIHNTRGNRSG
jgi:hypothetical protein